MGLTTNAKDGALRGNIMKIEIKDRRIIDALLQYTRDCKNTVTNEYPSINDTVESILYFYLIGNGKGRNNG